MKNLILTVAIIGSVFATTTDGQAANRTNNGGGIVDRSVTPPSDTDLDVCENIPGQIANLRKRRADIGEKIEDLLTPDHCEDESDAVTDASRARDTATATYNRCVKDNHGDVSQCKDEKIAQLLADIASRIAWADFSRCMSWNRDFTPTPAEQREIERLREELREIEAEIFRLLALLSSCGVYSN